MSQILVEKKIQRIELNHMLKVLTKRVDIMNIFLSRGFFY